MFQGAPMTPYLPQYKYIVAFVCIIIVVFGLATLGAAARGYREK